MVGRMLTVILVLTTIVGVCNGCKSIKAGRANGGGPSPEELKRLKEASGKFLPESFGNIWIGMREQEFQTARKGAKFQPARTDPDERRWYKELDKSGVTVWYGIERQYDTLAVIQFANRIPTWRVFSEHAQLAMQKYGTDYELYFCPTGDPRIKMTRILWPKRPISIMEAILEIQGSISVTMVLSKLPDARKAISRQGCSRIDKEEAMEEWVKKNLHRENQRREGKKSDDK